MLLYCDVCWLLVLKAVLSHVTFWTYKTPNICLCPLNHHVHISDQQNVSLWEYLVSLSHSAAAERCPDVAWLEMDWTDHKTDARGCLSSVKEVYFSLKSDNQPRQLSAVSDSTPGLKASRWKCSCLTEEPVCPDSRWMILPTRGTCDSVEEQSLHRDN